MALMSPMTDEEKARLMSAPASPEFSQVQHPMHALIAPLGAPPPEIGPMGMSPDQPSVPSAVEGKQSKVTRMSPLDEREDQLRTGMAKNPEGFAQKLGHFAGLAGRIAGDIVAPGQTEGIVSGLGKEGIGPRANEFRQKELMGIEKQRTEQGLEQAQTEQAGAQTAHLQQQTAAGVPVEISPEQADELEAPELAGTKVAPAILAQLYKQRGINATRVDTNQNTVQGRKDVANIQALSREQLAQLKPEQRDDRAIRLNQQIAEGKPLTQEESAYLKAYQKYINDTKTAPGVARAQAFAMFRPVQTIDPATNNVVYQTAGNAIRSGAATPQSMNFRTATGMAKFMTSGKGGQTITAYNTANDHLELLGKAMDALQNGDVQAINQLSNSFKQQFGSAAPTNVNAVKAMLAGELANVAKVTGATDPEIQEQRDNINRASSPEQIRGFIETNHDLMDQKAYEMYQQYQQGIQGQPAFHTGLSGHQPANGAGGAQPKVLKFNPATGRLE